MDISVVVPVYNVEKYIRECILSLLKQTLKNIEIIVVNDGSTDRSIENIQDLVEKHKNIKIINKKNGGLSSARNEGLKHAKGEYVAFIDSDDYIKDDFLEMLYNEGKKYDLDIVFSSYSKLYEDGNIIPVNRNHKLLTEDAMSGKEFLINQIKLNDYKMEVCDDIYRRDFLINEHISFNENILFEDEDFTLLVLLKAKRVKLVDACDYIYRQRENSITHCEVNDRHIDSLLSIISNFIDIYNKNDDKQIKMCVYQLIVNNLHDLFRFIDKSIYTSKKSLHLRIDKENIIKILKENVCGKKEKIKFILFKISTQLYWNMIKLNSKITSK
ncbi:glycosyltransferase [Romboutsia ilealis]|uniref:Glycosyltransferase n=1 Tax=Romboutsia faecis TaxID=2764597 RepID=A0ABR7JLN4_9FIRM|nr:glycosyltransferase [Romboutsia faecis]MBC5995845.1 glycosyltransferase [Romboutsia faecis]MRN23044.1 glycosyltransferase [Romboutsia ilealis]